MHRGPLLAAALVLACLAASAASLSPVGSSGAGLGQAGTQAGPPASPLDASLSLSIVANVSEADPGDRVLLFATTTNGGTEPATNILLEARLDPNTTYVQSFPNASYDPLGQTLRWTVSSLAAGAENYVAWTIQVNVGVPDNTTTHSLFRASYENATGVPKLPQEVETGIVVRAPVFSPQLRPNPITAERGDTVVARLYLNNTGSATAIRAWSNWTLNGHFQFLFLEEPVPVTNVSDGFRVTLTDLAPGPHALTAHLRVLRGLNDGLPMLVQTQWRATDSNGNLLAGSAAGDSVGLRAPRFAVDLTSSALQVNASSRFVLTVTFRNTGRATGIGWLNTTFPSGVALITDNVTFPRADQGKRHSWTIPSVAGGAAVALGITLESGPDPKIVSFAFTLEFTDEKGSPMASVPSPGIEVEIVPVPAAPDWFPWILLPAVAAGGLGALALLWWRRRASDVRIEDVFVADLGGHLLAHRSSGLVAYEDEDILVGMFKVIQDFVRDSFGKGTNDQMRSMEFGERKIIIERGRYHFIAVVYGGQDRGRLIERARKVSQLIDRRFGQALENWSGDLDDLRGLAALLTQVWKRRPRSVARVRRGLGRWRAKRLPSKSEPAQASKATRSESMDTELVVEPPR